MMNIPRKGADVTLMQGDCLDRMLDLPDNSVDLILTDPPYYRVKNEPWDRQWNKPDQFLKWLDRVAEQWHRVLKPNGSLYCFASPKMAARVEVMIQSRFNVLNNIRWIKEAGWHKKAKKEEARRYQSPWEACVFAEHYGADNAAKGETGYQAKCDELRGFVFEPLRAYLADEWARAGLTKKDANEACGNYMAGHYFTTSQWALPTAENYAKLQARANAQGGGYLRRDYEYLSRDYEYLRRDYEELREEYEALRRPFSVSADVQYTDVWTFDPVKPHKTKHPCEKPQDMLRHIITVSSRPEAVVLDSFMGNGSTGEACMATGRKFIGIEMSEDHYETACHRINEAAALRSGECNRKSRGETK